MSDVQVVVDDLDLTAGNWSVSDLEGWSNGGASVRRDSQPRPTAHGEFGERAWRGGRLVTITGQHVDYRSHEAVHAAEDALAALLADGDFGTVAHTEFGRTLTATMQLAEPPRVTWEAPHWFTYTLQLFSPDTFRYGSTSTASTQFAEDATGVGLTFDLFSPSGVLDFGPVGSSSATGLVELTNAGNAPAAPMFTVTGPTPAGGFVISDNETGRRLIFTGVVPAGQHLVFDARLGTVVLEGTASRLNDTLVEAWPLLDPGETRGFAFAPISDRSAAQLVASVTDTYY